MSEPHYGFRQPDVPLRPPPHHIAPNALPPPSALPLGLSYIPVGIPSALGATPSPALASPWTQAMLESLSTPRVLPTAGYPILTTPIAGPSPHTLAVQSIDELASATNRGRAAEPIADAWPVQAPVSGVPLSASSPSQWSLLLANQQLAQLQCLLQNFLPPTPLTAQPLPQPQTQPSQRFQPENIENHESDPPTDHQSKSEEPEPKTSEVEESVPFRKRKYTRRVLRPLEQIAGSAASASPDDAYDNNVRLQRARRLRQNLQPAFSGPQFQLDLHQPQPPKPKLQRYQPKKSQPKQQPQQEDTPSSPLRLSSPPKVIPRRDKPRSGSSEPGEYEDDSDHSMQDDSAVDSSSTNDTTTDTSTTTKNGFASFSAVPAPVKPVKKPKARGRPRKLRPQLKTVPRAQRYWLDQQAQLITDLESRGFSADMKPDGMFTCSLCHKDFETKLLCVRHAVEHLDYKPFRCADCLMEFTRCDTLQRHLKGRCLGSVAAAAKPAPTKPAKGADGDEDDSADDSDDDDSSSDYSSKIYSRMISEDEDYDDDSSSDYEESSENNSSKSKSTKSGNTNNTNSGSSSSSGNANITDSDSSSASDTNSGSSTSDTISGSSNTKSSESNANSGILTTGVAASALPQMKIMPVVQPTH